MQKVRILFYAALPIAIVLILLLGRTIELSEQDKFHISLEQVKSELVNFNINSLDDSIDDFSLNCSEDGKSCDRISKDSVNGIASTTWKVLFYSTLYRTQSDPQLKQQALDKALELTRYFLNNYANKWNAQAFVFAYAYINTQQVEFLKAFFYSSAAFTEFAITEKIFSYRYYQQIHPMEMVRYAEQILLVSKFLQTVPIDVLNAIEFELPNYQERYAWILNSKEQIVSQSSFIAERLLDGSKLRIEIGSYGSNQAPLKINGTPSNSKLDICWLALGYALAYKQTDNIHFSKLAQNVLSVSDLEKGYFYDLNAYMAQPPLACLNTYKILYEANQIEQTVLNKFLEGFLDLYLDNSLRPLCSKAGGILYRMDVRESSSYTEHTCKLNKLAGSDNFWLYEIISSIPDFNIELHDPYSNRREI